MPSISLNRLKSTNKRVAIVAGEASADYHGANLVLSMKSLDPTLSFCGIGGKKMEEAGVEILFPSSDMAVVGITEVLARFPALLKAFSRMKSLLKKTRPDLLILLDYPGFNLRLAGHAKRYEIPILYYISPQVWAWRRRRVKKIADRVDRIAVIFPFEEEFYRECNIYVEYVGHPLLDSIPREVSRPRAVKALGLERASPVLGLLPGSRKEEIKNHLPVMIKTAEILADRYPELQCLLPIASSVPHEMISTFIKDSPVPIKTSEGKTYLSLAACDLALVTSGTATLETAIMEVPMIVVYKLSPLSFWIARRVVKVPFISLVNLVAERMVVPELIQDQVNPQRLVQESLAILENGHERENMIRDLKKVKERLGEGGASAKAARMAVEMIRGSTAPLTTPRGPAGGTARSTSSTEG
ncbi:MAG: lipid-A-disaccharide synthase [Deltaproteobacteria bacterium]|nr:lipid-A-disaccharide synthase [Deltaproteobacteria bacterium]MBW2137521.1 lipid-A-disaccharide synthase [Deltaproteobacteria bacterium]